jgi:predicted Zn-dependent peptidase
VPQTFRQPTAPDARVLLEDQPESKSAEIRLAVRGLARSDRDVFAAALLARIVRERWQAAAPEVTSSFARHEAHVLPGIFVMGGGAPPAAAGKALSAAQEILRTLAANAPNATELERAKGSLLSDLQKSTPAELLADQWLDAETYKLASSNPAADISRVTPGDVQRVAARLFKDTPQAMVVVGNASELKSQLGANLEFPQDNKPDKKVSSPVPRKP